ncbi:helix-turn-helix domain-containing protein [Chryseobacterium sp. MDT2-18]|uniref:helix-turn-helix domain-containing protein n=1 Tax=Chryseobacterium sp. MDT2-18 TaxID=1259136 RepID=UPI0027866ADF|nr:helix-turn-helix transcriptional regulator [Chryseobacterium sp. MDT2-18]MDQ0476431.1 transcriptional regulator with XRE-family HTH domain [Chryseobacterium sp. MDT2-18]
METNEKIKHIRLEHDMTQNEFAASLGISRSALTQMEAGHTKPSFDVLEKLIDLYDIDVTIFFNAAVPQKKKLDNVLEVGQKVQKILAFYDGYYGLRYNQLLVDRLVQQVTDGYHDREKANAMKQTYEAYSMVKGVAQELEVLLVDPLKRYANKVRKQRITDDENDDELILSPDSEEVQAHLDHIMNEVSNYLENGGGAILDWYAAAKEDGLVLGEIYFTSPLSKVLYSSLEEFLHHFEILLKNADALSDVEHYYQTEHHFFGKL